MNHCMVVSAQKTASFLCRLMSDNVGSVIFGSGMVGNVGVAVGMASPSAFVQKLFPLPVFTSGL